MARDKLLSKNLILKNAKIEFLDKGFEKASMRTIARQSGLTVGAIYRYFKSKEDLFEALVQPTLDELMKIFMRELDDASNKQKYTNIQEGYDMGLIESHTGILCFLDYLYDNFDDFTLLFKCSQGTKFENIQDFFVDMEVKGSKMYIAEMEARGIMKNPFTETELHIFCSMSITPIFEIIDHRYDYEEAVRILKLMSYGQSWAWNKICLLGDSRDLGPSFDLKIEKEPGSSEI